jgi:hypothetical protein
MSLMRKPLYAVTVAVAAVLAGGIAAVPAQANTAKELKVCWASPPGTNYGIKVVLDGPSSRSKWLANGDCKAWNVKPGEYKVIWANADEIVRRVYTQTATTLDERIARTKAVCGPTPASFDSDYDYVSLLPSANVKRFQNEYFTYEVGNSGGLQTNVQGDRLTKINFRMKCEYYDYVAG